MKRFALFLAVFSFAVGGTARAQGVLLLTFDDRHWTKWEVAQPIFAKYNAHVTFFPYGTLDASALASLRRLQDAGHTVGIHTAHHKNAALFFAKKGCEAYWSEEVLPQKKALESGVAVRGFGELDAPKDAGTLSTGLASARSRA